MESAYLIGGAFDGYVAIDRAGVWGFKSPGGGVFFVAGGESPLSDLERFRKVDFVF